MVLRRSSATAPTGPTALWVLPVADVGGVTRHVLDVARTGIPGWRLVVALPPGPVTEELRAAGVEVHVVPVGPAHGLRRSLAAYRAVLREVRPDLVHTHLAYADLLAALGTGRTPLVTTEHGIAGDPATYQSSAAGARGTALAHRLRLRRTAALVAVSEATLDAVDWTWRPPPGLPRHVVRNGIDAGVDAHVDAPVDAHVDELHVVSLARLAPEKRLADLLDAFAVLARQHAAARLTLAGDGPLEHDLRDQVRAQGLTDRVRFAGVVAAGPLLAEADVLAQLSVWENCSYSLLDAMAAGVGVVAAPVGGNPEMLPARCLVDPADHDAVAAVLLDQARGNAERRPRLPAGWPDVATMTKLTAEVYADVTGPRR